MTTKSNTILKIICIVIYVLVGIFSTTYYYHKHKAENNSNNKDLDLYGPAWPVIIITDIASQITKQWV